jgi:hypothetical protein
MTSFAGQGVRVSWALLGFALAFGRGTAVHGADGPPVTTEVVLQAWQDRAARVKAFDVSWAGTMYTLDVNHEAAGAGTTADGAPKPPPNANFPIEMRLALDDRGRARFEYAGKTWASRKNAMVDEVTIDLYDGKQRKTFFQDEAKGFPSYHLSAAASAEFVRHVRLVPLRLALRPLDPRVGCFTAGELTLTDQQGMVDGKACLVLKHPRGTVWVDPARQFIPVRYFAVDQGKVTRQLEIDYDPDGVAGFLPKAWKDVRLLPAGVVEDSVTATVTKTALNRPLPDDTFEVQYPEGTWVRNYDTGERYIQRKHDKRPIPPGEYDGKNYEQLLHSEPPGSLWRGRWLRLVVINVVVIGVVVGALYSYRRIRRRQTPSTDSPSPG